MSKNAVTQLLSRAEALPCLRSPLWPRVGADVMFQGSRDPPPSDVLAHKTARGAAHLAKPVADFLGPGKGQVLGLQPPLALEPLA